MMKKIFLLTVLCVANNSIFAMDDDDGYGDTWDLVKAAQKRANTRGYDKNGDPIDPKETPLGDRDFTPVHFSVAASASSEKSTVKEAPESVKAAVAVAAVKAQAKESAEVAASSASAAAAVSKPSATSSSKTTFVDPFDLIKTVDNPSAFSVRAAADLLAKLPQSERAEKVIADFVSDFSLDDRNAILAQLNKSRNK